MNLYGFLKGRVSPSHAFGEKSLWPTLKKTNRSFGLGSSRVGLEPVLSGIRFIHSFYITSNVFYQVTHLPGRVTRLVGWVDILSPQDDNKLP